MVALGLVKVGHVREAPLLGTRAEEPTCSLAAD